MDTPLLPNDDKPAADGYVLPPKSAAVAPGANPAADLIRDKLAKLYSAEPDAKQELNEAEAAAPRSKHQQFMHELSSSGKDLATVQTEWHNYYVSLSPEEKHQVWQEFYASNANATATVAKPQPAPLAEALAAHKNQVTDKGRARSVARKPKERKPADLKTAIKDKVSAGGKLKAKHHVQSLLFGLGMGLVVVVIFLFGFFNEVILSPFIQPSRHASASQLIIDPNSVAPTATPEVIIPKINVEIPVDYSQTTTDENVLENALESGIVHYPTTSTPGENGNTAYFGHSSNNIFNPGKYKFAFVLLHQLVPGDTFYLTNNGKVFAYKVFSKTIVDPSDVGVLNPVEGHSATATLITCDPPGTSLHRLVVVGDQVSPDPGGNSQASAKPGIASSAAASLIGNGPTLWGRWWSTTYGKVVSVVVALALLIAIARRIARP